MNNINNNNFKTKILFGNLSNSERNLYDEISRLIDIPDVMRILDSSLFFVKEYLQQEFKQSSRFKFDKIHTETGVPLKESHEKRLIKKEKTSVKFSSYNKNEEQELRLSNFIEQKRKLRYFTMGSKQHPNQFERWSPEEMYNWWLELRTSDIPKSKWKILDAEFFLFINQTSCICNSYIRYGIKNNSNNKNVFKEELRLLSEYFILLDEFYKSGGEYGKLLDTHIAFCNWFQYRIRNDKEFKSYVEYQNQNESVFKLFKKNENENKINYTWHKDVYSNKNSEIKEIRIYTNDKNNFYLILFTSYFQNPSKFISLYSIPVITAVGVPHKSHNSTYYSPFSQIEHDIFNHTNMLLKYLIFLYNQKYSDDINIFRKKMIFLKLLSNKKDSNKKDSDAQLLFWYIIHELELNKYFIEKHFIFNINSKKEILSKYDYSNNNIGITDKNISKFFDIEFLLKQLKIIKYFLIELTPAEKREALPRILDSIDVLIETCKETINIVKNEQYNNYMRNQRNPHNI